MKKYCKKVCICIPAYNAEKTVEKTLLSLIKQTYKNISIYVVDNNSKDGTRAIVERYMSIDSRVKLFKYDNTVDAAENFDRCIKISDGEYTCIYHSDDIYHENIVQREVDILDKSNDIGAVFTRAFIINENDQINATTVLSSYLKKDKLSLNELFPYILKFGNCFFTPSAMVRTKIYKNDIQVHCRNKNFGAAFDVDVWIRILKNHNVAFIDENLMYYRQSLTSTSFNLLLKYRDTLEDHFFYVLDYNLQEMPFFKYNKKDYYCLKMRNELAKTFKAYVNGNYHYAEKLMKNVNVEVLNLKLQYIYFIFSVMIKLKLPYNIRKMMVYIKYFKFFRGQFKRIMLEK